MKTIKTLNGLSSQTRFHPFRSFGSRLSDTDGPPLQHSGPTPPPHMSRSGTYVQERGSTVHTDATTYVEHVPLKENGQHQITFFQAALCCWTPPAAGSQDRTQCCSLPVESIIVKHGRGITSAGGYKEIDALE